MKNYFQYQFKKHLVPLAVLFFLGVILYVIPIAAENYSIWNSWVSELSRAPTEEMAEELLRKPPYIDLYLDNFFYVIPIMCAAMPIYTFAYKMSKRSADMYYSVPLNKTKLATVHFIVGLATVLAAHSAAYLLGFIVVATKVKGLHLIYYLWIYLASLIPAFCVYTVTAFFYTRANTVIDGIIFAVLALFALGIVALAADHAIECATFEYGPLDWTHFLTLSPLLAVRDGLYDHIFKTDPTSYWANGDIFNDQLAGCIIIAVIAVGCTIGFFLAEKRGKAENCGQVSESVFGYKLMIPLYTVAMFVSLTRTDTLWEEVGIEQSLLGWAAAVFCAFVMTIIYKRNIKIGKKTLILLTVSIAAGLVASIALLIAVRQLNPYA